MCQANKVSCWRRFNDKITNVPLPPTRAVSKLLLLVFLPRKPHLIFEPYHVQLFLSLSDTMHLGRIVLFSCEHLGVRVVPEVLHTWVVDHG